MTLKNYLIFMSVITAFCWGVFIFVINLINPNSTNVVGFILFYLSLFLALVGTTALIGFVIRFGLLRRKLAFYAVKIAFRQSFLFALFLISLLFLLSQDLINWLNLILLIIVFSILEIIFSSLNNGRRPSQDYEK